nr:PEP/pyruvate-binding domain-containing protein [Blastococcus saxobsidens]
MDDRPTVGGKCASLGELLSAGIDVPDGFAVTVDAFELFRDTGGLRSQLTDLVFSTDPTSSAALDDAHRRATALICTSAVPAQIEEQIRTHYAELCQRWGHPDGDLPVAVRSSAVAEDGDATSFAGQQETYLWVVGADSVIEHVRACWASLYTPQAIAYRTQLTAEQAADATRISVAIQCMVDAAVAGVAFTVSPRTGDRSVIAINASWGLGHAVVSGEVTPDEFWVSKAGPQLTSQTIAHKLTQCVPDPSGTGVITAPVPADQRDIACLDAAMVLQLAELATRVEDHYAHPVDIEWALTRSTDHAPARLLLLQSRPETSWKARQAEARARRAATGGASYLNVISSAAGRAGGDAA